MHCDVMSKLEETLSGSYRKWRMITMQKKYLSELVLTGLFVAIIVVLATTPLGYVPIGPIRATIVQIPVIVGVLFCGPKKGAFLGFIFGLTSFITSTIIVNPVSSFIFSPVVAATQIGMHGIWYSTLICFVPRIIVGILPYWIYIGMKKISKRKSVNLAVTGVAGSLTNTVLVLGLIYLLYRNEYATVLEIEPAAVLGVIMGTVCANGLIEAVLSGVVVSGAGLVLEKIRPIR